MCKYEADATIRKRYQEIWLRENWEWNGSGSRFSAFLKIINFLDQTSLNIREKQRVSAACISENYPQIAGLKLIQDLERSYLAKENTDDLNLLLFILLGTWTWPWKLENHFYFATKM